MTEDREDDRRNARRATTETMGADHHSRNGGGPEQIARPKTRPDSRAVFTPFSGDRPFRFPGVRRSTRVRCFSRPRLSKRRCGMSQRYIGDEPDFFVRGHPVAIVEPRKIHRARITPERPFAAEIEVSVEITQRQFRAASDKPARDNGSRRSSISRSRPSARAF